MRRRDFIKVLGGAAVVWPLAARAQQAAVVRRVGMLSSLAETDAEAQALVATLHQTLAELGWVDGSNLRIDHRWAAGDPHRLSAFAKESSRGTHRPTRAPALCATFGDPQRLPE